MAPIRSTSKTSKGGLPIKKSRSYEHFWYEGLNPISYFFGVFFLISQKQFLDDENSTKSELKQVNFGAKSSFRQQCGGVQLHSGFVMHKKWNSECPTDTG